MIRREIAQLLFESVFGSPVLTHLIFSQAFANDMTIPSIMRVVYRNGKGAIFKDTERRVDDTISFISYFLDTRNPYRRSQILKRMNMIHSQYPIINDQMKYVVGTFTFDAQRVVSGIAPSVRLFTESEAFAVFSFWRKLSIEMGIHGIPNDIETFRNWYFEYREANSKPSVGCTETTKKLAEEWARRWFPKPLLGMGINFYYATCDDLLSHCSSAPKISPQYKTILRVVLIRHKCYWRRNFYNKKQLWTLRDFFEKNYRSAGRDFLEHGGYVLFSGTDSYQEPAVTERVECPFSNKIKSRELA